MTSFRGTLIFGVLIAGLVAFTVFDSRRAEKNDEQKALSGRVIQFGMEDVVAIELTNSSGQLRLEKSGDEWKILSPIEDTADNQAVQTFIVSMIGEQILQKIGGGSEPVDPVTFGLDQPVNTLTVKSKAGLSQTLRIGSVKAHDSNVYATLTDPTQPTTAAKIYVLSANWDIILTKPVRELRDKRVYRSDIATKFDRVIIRRKDKGSLAELVLVNNQKVWTIEKGGDGFPVSNDAVENYIEQIKAVRALEVIDSSVDGSSVGGTGSKNRPKILPELQIELRGEGATKPFVLDIAAPRIPVAGLENPNRLATSSDLVTNVEIYKTVVEALRKEAADFYDKKAPFKFVVGDVSKIDLKTKDVDGSFEKKNGTWSKMPGTAIGGLQRDPDSGKLFELLTKIAQFEASRIWSKRENAKEGMTQFRNEQRITLAKATGERIFEFVWGEGNAPVEQDNPEAIQILARTSAVDRLISVSESSVSGLGLAHILLEPPDAAGGKKP